MHLLFGQFIEIPLLLRVVLVHADHHVGPVDFLPFVTLKAFDGERDRIYFMLEETADLFLIAAADVSDLPAFGQYTDPRLLAELFVFVKPDRTTPALI